MQSDPWFNPPRPARRRRRGPRLHHVLALVILAVLAATVGLTPWAVHMGGRWTPTMEWDGFGPVQASNGGRYLLFTDLHGGVAVTKSGRMACSGRGCDSLHGTAQLCTANGKLHSFDLRGAVHGWRLTTDGARTSLRLTGGKPWPLQQGWVVSFSGVWDGPDLQLANGDNSFTEAFTPRGNIRRVTSTADAGIARTTLRPGSHAAFQQACRLLAALR